MNVRPLLNDPERFPDDNLLTESLGNVKPVWDVFLSRLAERFAGIAPEWNYYNDGKSWLAKLVQKKKTVAWMSVWPGFFMVSCYFAEKHSPGLMDLPIPGEWKDSWQNGKPVGKLKPLTVEVMTEKVMEPLLVVLSFKAGLK